MTVRLDHNTLAYTTPKGEVHFELNHFLNRLLRILPTAFGFRSYDIQKVLPAMQKMEPGRENVSNVEYLVSKLAKKAGLSQSDYENLKVLSRHYANPSSCVYYSHQEQISLVKFLEGSLGNKRLNQSIRTFAKQIGDDSVIHRKALSTMMQMTYRTRSMKALSQVAQKIQRISPFITSTVPFEKLTLRELIVMEEGEKLLPFFKVFDQMRLEFSHRSPLKELKQDIRIISDFTQKVQAIAEQQAPHAQAGSLIFYDVHNFAARRGFWGKLFDQAVMKLLTKSPIFHSSFGYRDEAGKDIEVDIWARFRKGRRSLFNRTYKTLNWNVEKLAGNDVDRAKLQRLYGTNWVQALESKYGLLLRNFFKDPKDFMHLYNPASRRLFVGLGLRWNPFSKDLKDRIELKRQAVCSEFTLKTCMQNFFKLQEIVDNDWKKAGHDGESPKLSHPIREHRRLHRVTPNEISDRLVSTGFAQEVPIAPIIRSVIDFHNYDLDR